MKMRYAGGSFAMRKKRRRRIEESSVHIDVEKTISLFRRANSDKKNVPPVDGLTRCWQRKVSPPLDLEYRNHSLCLALVLSWT
jgi:hypothetical protein